MLKRRYLITAEWLNNLMIIMLYYAGCEFFFYITRLKSSVLFYAAMALVVVCSYLQRVYVGKLPLYLFIHAAEFVIAIALPYAIQYKLLLVVILTVFFFSDLQFWTSGEERSFISIHPAVSLGFAFVFAYASVKDAAYLGRVTYVCGICFLCLYFLRTYLINGVRFSMDAQINAGTNADDMLKHNGRLVIPLIICFGVGMVLLQSDALASGLSRLIKFIFMCLGRFVAFLFSLFPAGTPGEEAEEVAGQFSLPPGVDSVPEWVLIAFMALEKVFTVFFTAAIIYFALKLIIRFFRIYFYRHGYDISSVDMGDHTEKREWVIGDTRKRMKLRLGPLPPRERIRRRYRRAVEHLKRGGYPFRKSHTPRERLDDIRLVCPEKLDDDFAGLSHEYEIARYSKE